MICRPRFQPGMKTSGSSHPPALIFRTVCALSYSSLQIHINFTLTAPTSTCTIPLDAQYHLILLSSDCVTIMRRRYLSIPAAVSGIHPTPRPRRKPRARSTDTRRLSPRNLPIRSRHVCAETDPRVPLSRSLPSRASVVSPSLDRRKNDSYPYPSDTLPSPSRCPSERIGLTRSSLNRETIEDPTIWDLSVLCSTTLANLDLAANAKTSGWVGRILVQAGSR